MLGRARTAFVLIFGGLLGAFVPIGCDVGDQKCPDDTLDTDLSNNCPYGPPGGPQKPQDSCPSIDFLPATSTECQSVSFDDVMVVFTGPGQCTLSACHGTREAASVASGVLLSEEEGASQVYNALANYFNARGEPYMAANEPRSWILCNIKAAPGGGSPMPKPSGLTDPDDIALVERWVRCGMRLDSGSGVGGGGGEGGGGEGGAGGGATGN